MEVRRGSQTLVGFPALIDQRHARRDRGLRRARCRRAQAPRRAAPAGRAAAARRAQVPREEHPRPASSLSVLYMPLGQRRRTARARSSSWRSTAPSSPSRCRPTPPRSRRRIDEGRSRLNLIASEVARSAGQVLLEHAAALRKLQDARAAEGGRRRHRRAARAAGAASASCSRRRGRSSPTCRAT